MMEMPRATEHHRKLHALAGSWRGEERLHPGPWDPQGGPATGRIDARVDLDEFFVVSDYVQERRGAVCYRGHGVYGWDASQKCYTMNWFDTMGDVASGPARGEWEGNTLTFRHSHAMGHSRYVYTFESDTRYAFRIDHSQDGREWAPFLEASYSRAR